MKFEKWLAIAVWASTAVLLWGGCANRAKVKEDGEARAQAAQARFEKGLQFLDKEQYGEAQKIFEKILVQQPAEEFDFVIMYNLGAALEGQKKCQEAGDQYQRVVRGSVGRFPRMEALALFRLSYTQECLGRDDKVLVTLLDAHRRAQHLPEDTAIAELPARLAAGYARLGNRKEAEKHFNAALKGIQRLQVKYKESRHLADTLAQTLYFMGRSRVSEGDFERNPVSQVKGLSLTQLYLLQAAELDSAKWSGRAVDEILSTYRRLWTLSTKLPAPIQDSDEQMNQRARRQIQAEVMRESLKSVRSLKAQRLPSRRESGEVSRLFNELEDQERQIVSFLSEIGEETTLTREAEKRQGLSRSGRVRASRESELEKNTRQSLTLPPKRKHESKSNP